MKKYNALLISCINEEITGTTAEKLVKVREIFETEKIYNNIKPSADIVQDWLQGLCSTVSIPFENHEIIKWIESQYRPLKEREYSRYVDNYWIVCGRALYNLLYHFKG